MELTVASNGRLRQISSFQALMLSLAGRVGAGNIAGVGVAVTLGGPGAVFWMWVLMNARPLGYGATTLWPAVNCRHQKCSPEIGRASCRERV